MLIKEISRAQDETLKYPKLYDRALLVDAQTPEERPERTMYFNYLTIYKHLNGYTHLGFDALATWIKQDENAQVIDDSETMMQRMRHMHGAFAISSDDVTLALSECGLYDPNLVDWVNDTAKLAGEYVFYYASLEDDSKGVG